MESLSSAGDCQMLSLTAHMDVFLVPVASDRYELYCEEPDEPEPHDGEPPKGVVRRLVHRFRQLLAEAERERRQGSAAADRPQRFTARVRARIMRYVAESIAEQRLLWQLRGRADAALFHPDDLTEAHAREILRRQLNRDFERHRFWLAIDSVGLIASAALTLLPGPNLVAYYFAFRIVGHFLSVRGARQGLTAVTWATQASAPLSALRGMVGMPPDARADRVHEVATTLRLEHFAAFFQRTATP
jgi:hypothetical protein